MCIGSAIIHTFRHSGKEGRERGKEEGEREREKDRKIGRERERVIRLSESKSGGKRERERVYC